MLIACAQTYGSNTGQGGYETLAVVEALCRFLHEKLGMTHVDRICMDAGSGYRSTPFVLGLRNMKALTGCSVGGLHYNESGEGKRNYTDGELFALRPPLRARAARASLSPGPGPGPTISDTTPRVAVTHSTWLAREGPHQGRTTG